MSQGHALSLADRLGPTWRHASCRPRDHNDLMLEMRETCEKCEASLPADTDAARICSYECTFCSGCTAAMGGQCPNCGGELLTRPRRAARFDAG